MEALVHNITWRALPERLQLELCVEAVTGSASKRLRGYFAMLAGLSGTAHLVQMFDSTVIRAQSRRRGQKGANRASARSLAWRVRHENPFENRP